MPRGDGTGPAGMGPRTGRGAGYCAGNRAPGFASAGRPGQGSLGTAINGGDWALRILALLQALCLSRAGLGRNRRF